MSEEYPVMSKTQGGHDVTLLGQSYDREYGIVWDAYGNGTPVQWDNGRAIMRDKWYDLRPRRKMDWVKYLYLLEANNNYYMVFCESKPIFGEKGVSSKGKVWLENISKPLVTMEQTVVTVNDLAVVSEKSGWTVNLLHMAKRVLEDGV